MAMKSYLKWLFGLLLLLTLPVCAKVETGILFVHLSDAMAEVKRGEQAQSQPYLLKLEEAFHAIPGHGSAAGQAVDFSLKSAKNQPNEATFEALSKALLVFEKEQNPVDYAEKRRQFAKRMMLVYKALREAIQTQQSEAVQTAYKRFNTTWTVNEKVVRETSLGHYGQIETAMTLLRIAMLSDPINWAEMNIQAQLLGNALTEFNAGRSIQPQASAQQNGLPQTLPQGLVLLEQGYQAMAGGETEKAKADITLFIRQWAVFEGEVRTRDNALYRRVESDLPLIMTRGADEANLQQFRGLIDDLGRLDIAGQYGAIDAMLILLREGLEALLIIIALLTTLKATHQYKAKYWVYIGAAAGALASLLGALALQRLFPAIAGGAYREITEGMVGIAAVLVMLFVGAWLHSKSNIQGWQRFVEKQLGKALATGSLVSMMSLSFLSVFREGAETILFYAGMLPLISTYDLLLGIGCALLLLAVIAWAMNRTSAKLPIYRLFKLMTWLIYALGFKILGVSVNALQLTETLPRHLIDGLPNVPIIGFYASYEGFIAQLGYLLAIPLVVKLFRH